MNNNNNNPVDRGAPKGLAPKRKRYNDHLRRLRRGVEEEGVLVGWPSLLLVVLLLSTNLRCVGSQDKVDDTSSLHHSISSNNNNNNNNPSPNNNNNPSPNNNNNNNPSPNNNNPPPNNNNNNPSPNNNNNNSSPNNNNNPSPNNNNNPSPNNKNNNNFSPITTTEPQDNNKNNNNHPSSTTTPDPLPPLPSTPKTIASVIDPKTSTNNTTPISTGTGSTSDRYNKRSGTGSTSDRYNKRSGTGLTSYRYNSRGGTGLTSDRYDRRSGTGLTSDRYDRRSGTGLTSYGYSSMLMIIYNSRGGTGVTSDRYDRRSGTGFTSYGYNSRGGTGFTSYGYNSRGGTGLTSYGYNSRGGTGFTSYGYNSRVLQQAEWEYDGNCMDKSEWGLDIDGPNYINEDDGRDAKISWTFPDGVVGNGSVNQKVKLKYTDLTTNSSKSKTCNSYNEVLSTYNYGGGFGFMGYGGEGSRPKHDCSCNGSSCDFTIQLNPETKYTMEMSVVDHRGIEVCPFEKETTSGIPTMMRPLCVLQGGLEGRKHNTYKIGINTEQYNDAHGAIQSVSLALAVNYYLEKDKAGWVSDLIFESGLRDNPKYKMPNAKYRVFDGLNTSVSMFVFGEDDVPVSEQNKSCLDCNYPLLPSSDYRFKVRVFTNKGYRDVENKTFQTNGFPQASSAKPAYVLVIELVVIAVVFISLAVLATKCLSSPVGRLERRVSVDLSWMLTAEELMRAKKPIRLTNLSIVCENLFRNGRGGLLQEFTELSQATPSNKDTVAALPVNAIKNRYSNIHPYDESRVILRKFKTLYHSDYINASYIHGHKRAKMFIAAQGPLNNTSKDFWRMVWEKQVHIIVMLTSCLQNGVKMCYKYWPEESETLEHSLEQLTVTSLREIVKSHFVARKFSLVKKGKKPRDVYQYQFVAWPHMGCPSSPDHLLSFLNQVKKAQPPAGHPIVVHCSAGVGRTGTFIGLYNLMDQMEQGDTVDIFNTVLRMRCHHPHMVQTLDQYAFIYQSMVMLHSGETGM
ncbi:hypothetical protein Pmani_026273 [Petrolisthes manimaculis]|uniref:protein-tyrosine-phosphatase n=1 Tax=Petrolisthes manimaculis TaxID=1843537 RepID=A0AAE1P666_9EUCA|nr:hypothetical protein Pmani_026273 [Petrolisthes manimaculis]